MRGWWAHWPAANLGLVTGEPEGIVAVDVDGPAAARTLLELAGGRPLGGLAVRTGRGAQLWYLTPEGEAVRNSAGCLADNVDVRGLGGYVVAPPSLHATGRRYTFAGGELGSIPTWLLELARPTGRTMGQGKRQAPVVFQGPACGATDHGRRALERECAELRTTPEGRRNHKLNQAAYALGRRVAGGSLAEALVVDELTAAALHAGLGERETAATIASGLRAGMQRPLTDAAVGAEIAARRAGRLLTATSVGELLQ